jgi:rod shape-determining protein MreD
MIVYIALKKGALQAEIIGFILGIILDVISIDIFGLKAMTFTILGYSCGKLLINFDSENIIIQIIAILLESLVYYIIINTMHFLFLYKYKQTMIFTLTYHPYSMLMSTGITIVTTPIIFKFLACLNKMLNK